MYKYQYWETGGRAQWNHRTVPRRRCILPRRRQSNGKSDCITIMRLVLESWMLIALVQQPNQSSQLSTHRVDGSIPSTPQRRYTAVASYKRSSSGFFSVGLAAFSSLSRSMASRSFWSYTYSGKEMNERNNMRERSIRHRSTLLHSLPICLRENTYPCERRAAPLWLESWTEAAVPCTVPRRFPDQRPRPLVAGRESGSWL